jgi:hypothetical protein
MIAPAASAKKKKKAPPITFEASGSFALSNPGDADADASVTKSEFLQTCAIPTSQGVDAYVVELSEEISKVTAQVKLSGSDAAGLYDLDMYYYGPDCAPTGSASTAEPEETSVFPVGTRWIVVSAWFGVQLEFALAATEIRF